MGHQDYYFIGGNVFKLQDPSRGSKHFKKVGNGNILLAGDVAHVHSPVGGQGMNLGICDAVAVAHAIRSHMKANDTEQRDNVLQAY